jgi:hypothetical protein
MRRHEGIERQEVQHPPPLGHRRACWPLEGSPVDDARVDPSDVGVESGVPLAERKDRNCCGRVLADPRELSKLVDGGGDASAMRQRARGSGRMQAKCTTRVAKSAPCANSFAGTRYRQL